MEPVGSLRLLRHNEKVSWSLDDWQEAVKAPDWGRRVLESLERYFSEDRWLLEPAQLVDVRLDTDSDGVPVILAVYDHLCYTKRIGLRRRLDKMPMSAQGEQNPEDSLAAEIALFNISAPLGRVSEILVEEDGVWWWGDGYPSDTELPPPSWLNPSLELSVTKPGVGEADWKLRWVNKDRFGGLLGGMAKILRFDRGAVDSSVSEREMDSQILSSVEEVWTEKVESVSGDVHAFSIVRPIVHAMPVDHDGDPMFDCGQVRNRAILTARPWSAPVDWPYERCPACLILFPLTLSDPAQHHTGASDP